LEIVLWAGAYAGDDPTRLAYVEVLAEEQQPTGIGFLRFAFSWLNGDWIEWRRVMRAIWLLRIPSRSPRLDAPILTTQKHRQV
jgi:hypothetical protein